VRSAGCEALQINFSIFNDRKSNKQLMAVPETIQRQGEATDAAIDKLVYELYALTEEEIKNVEGTGVK
jgi:hypothetical protein